MLNKIVHLLLTPFFFIEDAIGKATGDYLGAAVIAIYTLIFTIVFILSACLFFIFL